jgi:hypothetical protein
MCAQLEMKMSIPISLDRWTAFAPQGFRDATIRPIPCVRARFVVTIDGSPYAGFAGRTTAEEAVKLWSGEMTGGGIPISSSTGAFGWSAVRGRKLAIVER